MRSTRRARKCARTSTIQPLESRLLLAADLVGTLFVGSPAQVGLNHTVSATIAVKNLNGVPFLDDAGRFSIDFYLSSNSTISANDIYLTSVFPDGLGAGQTHSETVSVNLAGNVVADQKIIDPFRDDNQYFVGMIVDGADEVVESNESNNRNTGTGLDRAAISAERSLPSPIDGTTVVSTLLTVGTPASGDIWHRNDGGGGEYIGQYDIDTFRLSPLTGQTIQFDLDVEAFSSSSRLDSYMRLYDSNFALLEQNDNGADGGETLGTDSYFTHTFASAGTFYVVICDNNSAASDPRQINDRGQGGFGAYTLQTQLIPAAPGTPNLNAPSDTGQSSSDNITHDNTPTFSVTAPTAGTVRLYSGTTVVGQVTNTSSTTYTITASPALADGAYDFYATYTATADGIEGATSALLHVVIDTVAPSVAAPGLTNASNTGLDSFANFTNLSMPSFVGTMDFAATAEILIDGVSVTPVPRNGVSFSYTAASAINEGMHAITARGTDVAGNQATATSKNFTVDTIPPAAPALPDLDAASDSGVSDTDNITFDPTPAFIGTVPANHKVRLLIDTAEVGTVTTFASGVYSVSSTALTDGTHTVNVALQDPAGNFGPLSGAISITIDTLAPNRSVPGLSLSSDTGVSVFDKLTALALPTFIGTAEAQSTVTLLADNVPVGSTVTGTDGSYLVTPIAALAEGTRQITLSALDRAGNFTGPSAALTIKTDYTKPTITSGNFRFDTPPQAALWVFNEDGYLPANPITSGGVTLVNQDTAQPVTLNSFVYRLSDRTLEASQINSGTGASTFADGNYRIKLKADTVPDEAGNNMAGDATIDFFVLSADANRDRVVNALDFNAIATHFGKLGPWNLSGGDLNQDTQVNTLDFVVLASHFNNKLPAPATASPVNSPLPAELPRPTLFSSHRVGDEAFDALW